MSNEIIKVLDAICMKLGVAIDWTATNALPYIEELTKKYISFEIASSIFYLILWIGLTIIFFIIARFAQPKAAESDYDQDELASWIFVLGLIVTIVFGIIAIIVASVQTLDIITCFTLPEKKILEFAFRITRGI